MTATREAQVRRAVDTHAGLGHYMRTVTRDHLLRPEEEADLGKRVQAGQTAECVLEDSDEASSPVVARLRQVVRHGEQAQRRLLHHNMRLAIDNARKFRAATEALTDEYLLEDRIQDATIGLMRAVELFDPSKGYRFTTYATWWIRQALQRGSASEGSVRLPIHMWDRLQKLWAARAQLREHGGVLNVRSLAMVTGATEAQVEQAIEAEPRLLVGRLDTPVGDDGGGTTVGDLIPDPTERPEASAVRSASARALRRRLMEQLDDRDAFIMERRFGLHDDREWTLEEIGEALGLTRERIRQLQKKILTRLAADEVLRKLI